MECHFSDRLQTFKLGRNIPCAMKNPQDLGYQRAGAVARRWRIPVLIASMLSGATSPRST
jgi:hypothetical protein